MERLPHEESVREAVSIWKSDEILGGLRGTVSFNNVPEYDKKETETAFRFDKLMVIKVLTYEDAI